MSRLLAKRWAIALVVSLALNLFLGGMMTARYWMRPAGPPPRGMRSGPVRGLHLKSLRRHLDPSTYATLDEIDGKHAETIQQRTDEMLDARRRAMESLSAEDFDDAEAREAMADFRTKSAAAREAVHDALLDLAAALPADQRQRLGKAWGKKYRGKRGRGGMRGDRGGPKRRGSDGRGPERRGPEER